MDASLANPRSIGVAKADSYYHWHPFTSVGGLTHRKAGWNGSLRYRLWTTGLRMKITLWLPKGYFVVDAAINYTRKGVGSRFVYSNIFNTKWKTQFDTKSKLQTESVPVSEIHFYPGTPFFARLSFTVLFN